MNARSCKNVISLDVIHIHGGVLVFRKGESTEQYPHTENTNESFVNASQAKKAAGQHHRLVLASSTVQVLN